MTTIIKTILTGNKRLFQNKAIKRIPSSLREDKYFPGAKFLFSLALLLSGCGSYSNSFDCPIGDGLKCASLSEVNQKIDRGLLNTGFPSEQSEMNCPTCRNAPTPVVYWRSDLDQPSIPKGFQKLGRRTSGESRAAYVKYVSRKNPEGQRPQLLKGEGYIHHRKGR